MYDVIIIGAGSMGVAAGYYLAAEGQKVLLLDAHNPPHDFGSHHGDTRLIRFAYGEGERYVPFALRAGTLWEELEQRVKRTIWKRTGVLNFAPKGDEFLQNVRTSAAHFDIPIESLSAQQVNERWPGFSLSPDFEAIFEPTAGVLLTQPIIESYIELALAAGATLLPNRYVQKIEPSTHNVTVTTTNQETFTASKIIVTAGAWATKLLANTDLTLPMQPIRKCFAWYDGNEELYNATHFPGFAYINGDLEGYYGFPSIDGSGVKIGRHDGGQPIDPDAPRIPFGTIEADITDLHDYKTRFMPQVGALKDGKTCMYAMTPDEDFIIDRHPLYAHVFIAAGFSGHGFKFASAVGEALKELTLTGTTTIDLSPFSLARFQKIART